MLDQQLDELFKDGLDKTFKHPGKDDSWDKLAHRLDQGKKERRTPFFWLTMFLSLAVVAVITFKFNAPQSTLQEDIKSQRIINKKEMSSLLSEPTKEESTLDAISKQDESQPIESNSEQHLLSDMENKKDGIVLNEQLLEDKDCNCPDDEINKEKILIGFKPNRNDTWIEADDSITKTGITKESTIQVSNNLESNHSGQLSDEKEESLSILSKANVSLFFEREIFDLNKSVFEVSRERKYIRSNAFLVLGVQNDFSHSEFISDSVGFTPSVELGLQVAKGCFISLQYNRQSVNRSFYDEFEKLEELEIYGPDYTTVNKSNLKYQQHTFDLGTKIYLANFSFGSLYGLANLQFYQSARGSLNLQIETTYLEENLAYDLIESGLDLSAVNGGIGFSIPVFNRVYLDLAYRRQFILKNKVQRRGQENNLKLGVSYQL